MPDHRCDPYDIEYTGKPVVDRARAGCCGRTWVLDLSGNTPRWIVEGFGGRPSQASLRTPTPRPPAYSG